MTNDLINKYCDDALCRIAAGEMDALAVIYDKLGRRIFLLALSILRDKECAEDIMQDTFLKIAAQAHAYKEKSNATAFILTVTRNLSLNLLAKRRRSSTHERPLDAVADIADSEDHTQLLSASGVPQVLFMLEEDERQIIVMKLEGGMKHKDIAVLLGISQEACQKRYRRALEKLKNYYKQEGKR